MATPHIDDEGKETIFHTSEYEGFKITFILEEYNDGQFCWSYSASDADGYHTLTHVCEEDDDLDDAISLAEENIDAYLDLDGENEKEEEGDDE